MPSRRQFLIASSAVSLAPLLKGVAAPARRDPILHFYGSTQQVSGSCHLLETSRGLYLVDCGMFTKDIENTDAENQELPFDPRDVQGVFLTHAHSDHNGRLPLLYARGFRGPVYCTDCTRDISRVMLDLSASLNEDEAEPLYGQDDVDGVLGLFEALPYNTRIEREGIAFRYTDAGHILGSAMVEVWVDGRKIIFSGDIGPMHTPILCRPTQHFEADAVLIESTYGPVGQEPIDYHEFGRRLNEIIARGGSILLPSFALHKTQTLVFMLHSLVQEGILPRDVPIISDSSTAHQLTRLYDTYREYYDGEAKQFLSSLYYRGEYKEYGGDESLRTHESDEPAIYISTSGMLEHALSPKHLTLMAEDPRNAVILIGYQAPGSIGRRLLDGEREVRLPWEERQGDEWLTNWRDVSIDLEVAQSSGFSSHARGQQILEWLSGFRELGQVFVVHGDAEQSTGMAGQAQNMGLNAVAPIRGETFAVTGERVMPGDAPTLAPRMIDAFSPVDR